MDATPSEGPVWYVCRVLPLCKTVSSYLAGPAGTIKSKGKVFPVFAMDPYM